MSDAIYQGYLYGYPHKTAYRPLDPPVALAEAWRDEPRSALFLYAHVPFCEMRCGFCNLFTLARPPAELVEAWLDRLDREVDATAEALPGASFARFAVGGGTPTWLDEGQLARLFATLGRLADLRALPGSVEVSPGTATPERIGTLVAGGATRISMGVQSFVEAETAAVYRPQPVEQVLQAVRVIREARAPVLNLDLMYGLPGQTEASFRASLARVVDLAPEEVFVYPLYVREQTGLARHGGAAHDAHRLGLYRVAREVLRAAGFRQRTMRSFVRRDGPPGPAYRCQEDGMVGVGVGARSYTTALHWSTEFAVRAPGIRAIVEAWIDAPPGWVRHGFRLDADEQQRRWVILSLLGPDGLSAAEHASRFARPLPAALDALVARGFAAWSDGVLTLTPEGVERSDAIGPSLVSDAVRARMEGP